MQIGKARGWTGAVVYFDAITALAAMLRALVCHQCSRDHPTADALIASGFSADEVATMSRGSCERKDAAVHRTFAGFCPMLCPARGRLRRECRKWRLRVVAPRLANLWRILLLV